MSIKLNLMLLVLAVILFTGLPVSSYAGNQANAAAGGSVTGMFACAIEEGFTIDESSLSIDADGCSLQLTFTTLGELNCAEGDDCSMCFSTLKRHGLTVTQGNAYKGGEEAEEEELAYHLLEGNAGPFLDRLGECPIPD